MRSSEPLSGGAPTARPDPVMLTGSGLALIGCLLPILLFRENRVSRGTGLFLWQLPSGPVPLLLLLAAAAGLVLSFRRRPVSLLSPLSAAAALLLFILPWVAAGITGRALIGGEVPHGRISPSWGFWLCMAGGWMMTIGISRTTAAGRWVRRTVPALAFGSIAILAVSGYLDPISFVQEFRIRQDRFFGETANHFGLAFSAVGAAAIIGIPLGILAYRSRKASGPVFSFVNTIQTVPSLALFGLMIAPLSALSRQFPLLRDFGIQGIGNAPAFLALTLYALLPIVRNTYTGLSVLSGSVLEAGRGMGMSRLQLLRMVEIPLALPIVLGGIRVSAVQAVGNTTVAALIGAGGFGVFIFQGLGQAAPDLIILGVIPVILSAVLTDRIMKTAVRLLSPGDPHGGTGIRA